MTNTKCTGELVSAVISNGTETHYHNGTECPGHAPATEYVSKRFGRNGSAIHLAYADGNTPKCGAYFRPGSGVTVTEPATCRKCLA